MTASDFTTNFICQASNRCKTGIERGDQFVDVISCRVDHKSGAYDVSIEAVYAGQTKEITSKPALSAASLSRLSAQTNGRSRGRSLHQTSAAAS